MRTVLHGLYLLIIALWVGGVASFTFVVTPRIFSHYDRDTASKIVDVLFPVYFPYNFVLSALALLILATMWQGWGGSIHRISFMLALVAVLINLYVMVKLYPDIMVIKRQVTSFVNMSPDAGPRAAFRRLHAVSAIMNLAQLCIAAALLFLGRALP